MRRSGAHGMFPSDPRHRAQLPRSHFFITVARGHGARTFALRPYAICCVDFPVAAGAHLGGGGDSLHRVPRRHARRLSHPRSADAIRLRGPHRRGARRTRPRRQPGRLLDQTSFEGRMHELLTRQARIDEHDRIIEALATQGADRDPLSELREHPGVKTNAVKGLERANAAGPARSGRKAVAARGGEACPRRGPRRLAEREFVEGRRARTQPRPRRRGERPQPRRRGAARPRRLLARSPGAQPDRRAHRYRRAGAPRGL